MTIIINDPPYGTERAWNALRLALASSSAAVKSNVNIFLLGTGFPRLRRVKIRLKATTTWRKCCAILSRPAQESGHAVRISEREHWVKRIWLKASKLEQ